MCSTRNTAHSVRARLQHYAREKGRPFDIVLARYAIERLIYRLSRTPHGATFILKGAALVTSWFDQPHRPTRDVDFLAYGRSDPDAMVQVFRDACSINEDDGLRFDHAALRAQAIREHAEYGGVRLAMFAYLDRARIPMTIDIGFGDAVVPPDELITLPVLLDFPAPRIRAYARETVIAEKAHAIVELGFGNSRMKDFYDIWFVSRIFEFNADRLGAAIASTFARRATPVPNSLPIGLSDEFSRDPTKRIQWNAFARPLGDDTPPFETIVADLREFLMPYFERISDN